MVSSPWLLLLVGAVGASATMICVWLVSIRIHNASYVDVAWAFGIAGTRRRLRAARGRLGAASRPRRRARHDLGRPPRHVPPLAARRQGGGRALPGAQAPLGPEREPRVLRLLPGAGRVRPRLLAPVRVRRRRSRRDDVARVGRCRARARVDRRRGDGRHATGGLEGQPRQQGQDGEERPLGLVPPPELLLRVAALGGLGDHRLLVARTGGSRSSCRCSCSRCSSR